MFSTDILWIDETGQSHNDRIDDAEIAKRWAPAPGSRLALALAQLAEAQAKGNADRATVEWMQSQLAEAQAIASTPTPDTIQQVAGATATIGAIRSAMPIAEANVDRSNYDIGILWDAVRGMVVALANGPGNLASLKRDADAQRRLKTTNAYTEIFDAVAIYQRNAENFRQYCLGAVGHEL